MIQVVFDDVFQTETNGQVSIEVPGPATLKEVIVEVFSRFPQLCVRLTEDRGLTLRTLLLLNDETLLEQSDIECVITDGDTIHLCELPCGAVEGVGEAVVLWLENSVLGYVMSGSSAAIVSGIIDVAVNIAISMAVSMALSAIMGAIFGDVAPPDTNMGVANSATYTFDGVKNTSYSGAPVHLVYGLHRAGGNILNVYVRNDYVNSAGSTTAVTDKTNGSSYTSYLYTQIGVCEGEIEEISDIYVNKMPRNFYNGVGNPEVRTGTAAQEIMLDYSRVETTTSVSRKVLCLYRTSDNSRLDFSVSATDPLFGTALSSATPYYAVLEEAGTTYRVTPGAFKIPRVWPSSAGG